VDAVDPIGLEGRRIGLVSFTLSSKQEQLIARSMHEIEAADANVVDVTLPRVPDMYPLFREFEAALHHYSLATLGSIHDAVCHGLSVWIGHAPG